MRGAKAGAVSITLITLLLTGCTTTETPPVNRQPVAAEVAVPTPNPQYLPTVEAVRPVNNEGTAANTCNRAPGAGVIMSFDDFGTPEQVETILKTLKSLNWRAMFFPTGDWALDNWGLIQHMQQDGHIVGSHTMSHPDLVKLYATDESKFYGEIYPLRNFATTTPMLLRPPFGSGLEDPLISELFTDRNIQLCGWTADSNDWRGGTASELLDRVMNGYKFSPNPLQPDGVVLAHMHGEHTVEFIRLLAAELDRKGWYREPLKK